MKDLLWSNKKMISFIIKMINLWIIRILINKRNSGKTLIMNKDNKVTMLKKDMIDKILF
jgi:hypothetical protein